MFVCRCDCFAQLKWYVIFQLPMLMNEEVSLEQQNCFVQKTPKIGSVMITIL